MSEYVTDIRMVNLIEKEAIKIKDLVPRTYYPEGTKVKVKRVSRCQGESIVSPKNADEFEGVIVGNYKSFFNVRVVGAQGDSYIRSVNRVDVVTGEYIVRRKKSRWMIH